MHIVYSMCLMFKHWFCWKYQYNKYMFNFIDHLQFIPVSGCVGIYPSALLCPGAYNADKMALMVVAIPSWHTFLVFVICVIRNTRPRQLCCQLWKKATIFIEKRLIGPALTQFKIVMFLYMTVVTSMNNVINEHIHHNSQSLS